MPHVSVVIAARNEGENLSDTVTCLLDNAGSVSTEVIVVDDGSTDGCGALARRRFSHDHRVSVLHSDGLGVAGARNHGASLATGDVLVFLDAHCWCPPGWLGALIRPLANPRVGLAGPAFTDLLRDDHGVGYGVSWPKPDLRIAWLGPGATAPYAVPLMPGGCDAIRRDLFRRLLGYDTGMGCWGSEGEELSLRVWLTGYEVQVVPECVVRHLFREAHPYHVDPVAVLHNRLRVAALHFSTPLLNKVIEHYRHQQDLAAALTTLLHSDVYVRRAALKKRLSFDISAWFDRFSLRW